jgi:threonine dehydrogenase-like Zn-dependent dehydrogenase
MWTSTLDLDPKRILLTRLLGQFWPGAYFSSFAPLRVENVPRGRLAASNWVRVRNRLAGICGSDLHLIYAKGDLRVAPAAVSGRHPSYLGHEVVGEVIEVGEDVQHLHIGDRVVLQYSPNCLSTGVEPLCYFCATGRYNLCERGELPHPTPIGGGWSEEMLLPEQQLFRVPESLSDEQAVMLEPTAVALHAILRRLPQPDEHALVIGAGTIGLLTVMLLRALVPEARISVLARYPFQIEQATRLGVEHIIYPQDGYQGVQQVTHSELHHGWLGNQMLMGGFDVIYDTIGTQKTLHDALRWARAASTVVLVGVDLHMMHLDMTPVWYQEINLLGSLSHGIEGWPPETANRRSTFSIATELIARNRLRPESLITHRFALTNYQHALTTAISKSQNRAIKIVFDYALLPASVVPHVRASTWQRRLTTINTPLPPAEPLPEIQQPQDLSSTSMPEQQPSSWKTYLQQQPEEEDASSSGAIAAARRAAPSGEKRNTGPKASRQSGGPESIAQSFPGAPVTPLPASPDSDTGAYSWHNNLETVSDEVAPSFSRYASAEDETFINEETDEDGELRLPHPVAEDQETPQMETAPLPDEVAAIFAMEEEAGQDEPESPVSEEMDYEMPDVSVGPASDDEEAVSSGWKARQMNRKKKKEGNKRRF